MYDGIRWGVLDLARTDREPLVLEPQHERRVACEERGAASQHDPHPVNPALERVGCGDLAADYWYSSQCQGPGLSAQIEKSSPGHTPASEG